MLTLETNAELQPFNTMAIRERAEYLVRVESDVELREALAQADARGWPVTLLGGGSNIVVAGPVSGLVVVMCSRGRRILQRRGSDVLIEAEAGENWHRLVGWSLDLGWVMLAYAVIQFLDGNVLVPLLLSEAVDLHPITIIVAVLAFGGLWGLWGVFFAIPLATLVKAIYTAWPRAADDVDLTADI